MADDEFQELLVPVQNKIPPPQGTFSLNAHNQVIVVMAAGGMKKRKTSGFKQVLLQEDDFDWKPVVHFPQIGQMASNTAAWSIWDSAIRWILIKSGETLVKSNMKISGEMILLITLQSSIER
ncbi:MAG: hypothetical protein MUO40_13100 [Anaerolineaceae bacterium]|nr:hypothetical protein [Anaerolineaceae bacterium]